MSWSDATTFQSRWHVCAPCACNRTTPHVTATASSAGRQRRILKTVSLRGSSPIRVMGKLIAVDELPLGLAQLSLRADIPGTVTCAVVSVALAVPAPACIAVAQRRWRWGCLWRGGLPGRFLLPRTLPIRCPATAGGWTDLDRLDSDRRPAPCPCIWNLRRGARDGERDSKSDK